MMNDLRKIPVFIIMGVLIGCASTTVDDQPNDSIWESQGQVYSSTPFGETRVVKFYSTNPNVNRVRGVCFITLDPDTPFGAPCRHINFILFNSSGVEVEKKQTDLDGRFHFAVEKHKRYTLKVESEKYKTAAETIHVVAGAELLVRLIKVK